MFFATADLQSVDLTADSSASEVKQWLESKGFTLRFVVVNPFNVLILQKRRNVADALHGIGEGRRGSLVVYGAGFEIWRLPNSSPSACLNVFVVILCSTPRSNYVNSQLVTCDFPSDRIQIKAVMIYFSGELIC